MRLPRQQNQRPFLVFQPLAAAFLALFVCATPSMAQVNVNPTAVHFGSITIGQSASLPFSLTNQQSTSVTISAANSSSSEFSASGLKLPLTLGAGQTANLTVVFAPTANGWSGGRLAFTTTASNKTAYLLIGGIGVTGDLLVPTPLSLGFGSVALGSSSTLPVAFKNTGTVGLVITQASVTGTGFSLGTVSLPAMLLPNQTLTLNVQFAPQTASSFNGSLVVLNGGGFTIPLTGTGTNSSQLILSPASLSFGNVDVGSSGVQTVTLTANGGAVTVNSSASTSSQFALQGASFPFTIASGQSVSLNVAFAPSTTGTTSGTLSVASNASNSNAMEGMSGVGIQPQSTVTVSWNASVSQVAGYNVYRGTTQGTYSKVNSSLNTNTSYVDNTVSSGTTYYYVATSVDSSGTESAYSSPVTAKVP